MQGCFVFFNFLVLDKSSSSLKWVLSNLFEEKGISVVISAYSKKSKGQVYGLHTFFA